MSLCQHDGLIDTGKAFEVMMNLAALTTACVAAYATTLGKSLDETLDLMGSLVRPKEGQDEPET
jgi:hypothetical protein